MTPFPYIQALGTSPMGTKFGILKHVLFFLPFPHHRMNDTAELMEAVEAELGGAGAAGGGRSLLGCADDTQALLVTFAYVESPQGDALCLDPAQGGSPGQHAPRRDDLSVIEVIPGMETPAERFLPYRSAFVLMSFNPEENIINIYKKELNINRR